MLEQGKIYKHRKFLDVGFKVYYPVTSTIYRIRWIHLKYKYFIGDAENIDFKNFKSEDYTIVDI